MSTLIELPHAFQYYQHAYEIHVIVVGCGGTGGYLVPNLARLLANATDKNVKLFLMDGDEVETKNLKRQNFIASDLGKNKARVLAERYSAALGYPINYTESYLKDAQQLEELSSTSLEQGSNIVIGCVDNHRTRQVILEWFRAQQGRFWIDAGNEEMNGQVVCGFNYSYPYCQGRDVFRLPCVADLFPEVEADKKAMFNDELSCAERAQTNPQNIATNVLAANTLLSFAQQVILGKPLHAHGVFFSSEQATADAMLNLPSRLDPAQWPGTPDTSSEKEEKEAA